MSLPSLPQELLYAITLHLSPRDIASLRLVSPACYAKFASPEYCSFLLSHFFPFAATSSSSASNYQRFNALCARLYRLHRQKWTQVRDLAFPPPENSVERVYPGFHYFDAATGALVTAESSLDSRRVGIVVRWLSEGGRAVPITAPLELTDIAREGTGSPVGGWLPISPPSIFFRNGMVLVVYPRDVSGSLALLLDGKTDGRTMWTSMFDMSIFPGVQNEPHRNEKRLSPVWNRHYIAFLTALDPTGSLIIVRFPPHHDIPTSPIDGNNTVHVRFQIRPENLHSLVPDTSGNLLLAGESFPTHENLHRVVLINAVTGEAARALHMPMAPAFSSAHRDWSFGFTPGERELIMFASARDPNYRAALAGQVFVFPLSATSNGKPRIRYLLNPPTSAHMKQDLGANITYDSTLNTTILLPSIPEKTSVMAYDHLNMFSAAAGSGEIANRHNSRMPRLLSHITPPPHPFPPHMLLPLEVKIGKEWVYMRSVIPSTDEIVVHLFRLSIPPPGERETPLPRSRGSFRSVLSGTTSGWSTPGSIAGMMGGSLVDPDEPSRRLKEMAVSEKPDDRESGLREVSKGVINRVEDVVRRVKSEKHRRSKLAENVVDEGIVVEPEDEGRNRSKSLPDSGKRGWRDRLFGR